MDGTINHAKNTFCFLDDILIVQKDEKSEHAKLMEKFLKNRDNEYLALKI